jgi:hypothetical protein
VSRSFPIFLERPSVTLCPGKVAALVAAVVLANTDYFLGGRHEQLKVRPVSIIVKAEGPSGHAKIHSDDPKHALGLAQYLRTIGYNAWIEDTNGNEIDEKKDGDCR